MLVFGSLFCIDSKHTLVGIYRDGFNGRLIRASGFTNLVCISRNQYVNRSLCALGYSDAFASDHSSNILTSNFNRRSFEQALRTVLHAFDCFVQFFCIIVSGNVRVRVEYRESRICLEVQGTALQEFVTIQFHLVNNEVVFVAVVSNGQFQYGVHTHKLNWSCVGFLILDSAQLDNRRYPFVVINQVLSRVGRINFLYGRILHIINILLAIRKITNLVAVILVIEHILSGKHGCVSGEVGKLGRLGQSYRSKGIVAVEGIV